MVLCFTFILLLAVQLSYQQAPTTVHGEPSYGTRKIGENYLFKCSGNNKVTKVTWIKDGVELDPANDARFELKGTSLSIPSVTADAGGKYRCQVSNEFGSKIIGWDLTLVVPYMDKKFLYTPRDNHFYASKRQAWANCAAPAGSPRPTVTFINGSSNRPIDATDPRIEVKMYARGPMLLYQMIINDATEHELHDKWACKASNQAESLYSYFKVEFYPPPPPATNIRFTDRLEGFIVHWDFVRKDLISYDFRLTTSDKKVLDYSMAESTRENVYFLKYEIRGIERGTEYSFQMRSVDRDNQIGEWSSPIKYTTVSEIKPYVDATMPLKTALGEGIEKTITCNIRGEPMPKIEWTKNGVAISESDPEYEMVNDKGELIFLNPVREATNGEYQCKGTNEFGSILNNPTKVNVEWIEENFQFIPRNQTFYRGLRFIRISCRPPVSDPAPKITWLWNDRKVNPHSVPNFATSNYLDPRGVLYNALEIRNPGTVLAGNYSCVASNVGGERISDFTVTEILPKKPFSTISPRYLNQFRANESVTESLSCKFLGDPIPSIVWYKDNEPIDAQNNPHFTASEDGFGGSTLNMVSLSKHHHGFYYCNASNHHGSTTSDRSIVQITYIDDEFVFWSPETFIYSNDRTRAIDVVCRPPLGYPTTRIVWSNGTEDNLQYEDNPDLTFVTDDLANGMYVMRVENPINYLGDRIGCAAYNEEIGFAGKYKLQLSELVIIGAPEFETINYKFESYSQLTLSWSLKKARYDVEYTIQLKQGDAVIYTNKTKALGRTINYEGFPDATGYSVVLTASDPASQQTEMTKSIADSDILPRPSITSSSSEIMPSTSSKYIVVTTSSSDTIIKTTIAVGVVQPTASLTTTVRTSAVAGHVELGGNVYSTHIAASPSVIDVTSSSKVMTTKVIVGSGTGDKSAATSTTSVGGAHILGMALAICFSLLFL